MSCVMEECVYTKFGCDEVISNEKEMEAHRKQCKYRPCECPFNCTEVLRFHELKEHLEHCENNVALSSQSALSLCTLCKGPHERSECPEALIMCVVPGCEPYKKKLAKFHNVSHLRSHCELIANYNGHMSGTLNEFVKDMLRLSLLRYPEDLCVLCFLAEGDTGNYELSLEKSVYCKSNVVMCRSCKRYCHEECDSYNMASRLCFECREMIEKERKENSNNESEQHMLLLDEDEDEDEDEDDISDVEANLTGFVVDDDHISWSSADELERIEKNIEDEEEGDEEEEMEEQEKSSSTKRKKPFVIDDDHLEEQNHLEEQEKEEEKKSWKKSKKNHFIIESPTSSKSQATQKSLEDKEIVAVADPSSVTKSKKKRKKKKKKKKQQQHDNE